jgi:hypothetical protein
LFTGFLALDTEARLYHLMEAEGSPVAIKRPANLTSDEPHFEISSNDISTNDVASSRATVLEVLRTEETKELVTWDGPDDPENPKNWSYAYKWWVTAIICLAMLNV